MSWNRHAWRGLRVAVAGSFALALTACALPRVTQRPAQVEYRLSAPGLRQAGPAGEPVILRVLGVQAAPGFDGVPMLYSPRPTQLMPYRDSRWLVPPAEMIGSALRQTLARQPWVAAVEGDGSPGAAPWVLSCRLDRLEHDVYSRRVVLDMRCELFGDSGNKLRAAWDFDAAKAMPVQDAQAYAQATQDLLGRALAQALRRIAEAVQGQPPAAASSAR